MESDWVGGGCEDIVRGLLWKTDEMENDWMQMLDTERQTQSVPSEKTTAGYHNGPLDSR